MAKKKMIIYDDTILVDFKLVFDAIREEKGDWQKVEKELQELLESVSGERE
ncbi:MAG: hypothetical protein UX85_C0004G0044 [Candidatus Beckwithbacteria bacterium GW2011_GWB1_47_15]|uniref:Uncharacterized protein n=1 Tax=Candidatus Beckwithbacteria bacterium GW2011_GWB1_47_15 TaxID=1618371 RepID=A0A0G1U493_9BACT|nr:MAG: hypothetical protein UY43_C0001G0203 [Candidatus Beckwithbacteria bacterium GW2011_GWC1_49_16]KKU35448.1 MAG: hypothetical protein UX50_C0003G0044 [Candidatus Beckwithbacteria bacterium GW2011_GWA1_46_30]KKU61123.1 MAG: hypothetical protein UX85_C0004G0044 [Candidatus Beckwithbacteria bacterium GW2011_GWB1_47_15]KKU71962.1 MAG: hypothetical protein UX97_C0002G0044 [Candidatus Beckwithbacteria bacterium GW2011_GWA2_47_25]KKW03199.1 MAG: hypothetical protein UY37_C0006G0023 [Candidatus Be